MTIYINCTFDQKKKCIWNILYRINLLRSLQLCLSTCVCVHMHMCVGMCVCMLFLFVFLIYIFSFFLIIIIQILICALLRIKFKLKARRSIPTYTLTCNKHITLTDTQQGQQCTVHTHGVKAGRSLLGNGKENKFLYFVKIKLAASCTIWREGGSRSTRRKPSVTC